MILLQGYYFRSCDFFSWPELSISQISDGVQPAFSALPTLIELFPEEKENIKIILLLSLFNNSHVGGMLQAKASVFFQS